ncbi:MAG TPA: TonB-dependent receptor, partial [Saprospiraceae bacterium]|nr:TonB-dependent receptor [Saprospiraceae bacterium]
MRLSPYCILVLLFGFSEVLFGQKSSFDSFISVLTERYHVDVAVAPELIPVLDSIKNYGKEVKSIEDFLGQMLDDKYITYQIIDGNKVLLRQDKAGAVKDQVRIEGIIKEKNNHTPLSFAAVNVLNSPRGTYTDEDGHFILYAGNTSSALQVNYLGYKSVIVPIEEFEGKQYIVEMETDNISLDQVVIIVPFYQITSGTESHSVDLNGYKFISENDVLGWNSEKLISQMTAYTHFSSEKGIRLRGSEEENSLVIMDQLPVYDPYHFYNIFSPFNGHYFSSVSLYKNNMPVEYGGRIDGLIDVSSRSNKTGSSLIFDTDLLLTSLAADVEISDKISFTAGGRFSHTGMLDESLRDSASLNFKSPGHYKSDNEYSSAEEPTFNFYDINLGLNAVLGKKNSLSISYFKNQDYLDNIIVSNLTTTIQNLEIATVEQVIETNDDWGNEGAAATFETRFNDHIKLSINGFLSAFEKDASYHSMLEEVRFGMPRNSSNSGFQNSILQSKGLKAFLQNDVSELSGYTIGLDFQQHQVDLVAKENTTPYLLEVQEENETTVFGEYNYSLFNNLNVAVGGRLTHLKSTADIYPLPNIRLNYAINDHFNIKSAFSKNIQVVRELTVENRFGREIEFLALS